MQNKEAIITKPSHVLLGILAVILIALVSNFGYGAWKNAEIKTDRITAVSLITLIATPEKFDGKLVSAEGYFVYEDENIALYLNETDEKEGVVTNAVELNFHNSKIGKSKLAMINHRYIKLIGRVYSNGPSQWPLNGAVGVKSPVIGDIVAIYELPLHPNKFGITSPI